MHFVPSPSVIRIVGLLGICAVAEVALAVPTEIAPDKILYYDWSQTMNMNALRFVDVGADDFVYYGVTDDPWITESLVSFGGTGGYDFGVYNKTNGEAFDGLILLIAYRGSGADFTMQLDSSAIFQDDNFKGIDEYSIFGPGGNRPGDGQAALYNGAEGVMFVDLNLVSPLSPGGTANIDLTLGGSLPMDFSLNFNAYGYLNDDNGGPPRIVTDTNPNSGDLTVAVPEASTLMLFGSGLIGILGFLRRKAPSLTGR